MAAGRGAGGGLDGGTAAGAAETILSVDPEGLSDLERGKLVLMLQAYVDSLNQLVRGLGATGGGPPPPPAAAEAEVQAPAQGRASAETARKGASGSGEESPRDEGKGKRRRQAGDRGAQKEKSARVVGVEASPAPGGGRSGGAGAGTGASVCGDREEGCLWVRRGIPPRRGEGKAAAAGWRPRRTEGKVRPGGGCGSEPRPRRRQKRRCRRRHRGERLRRPRGRVPLGPERNPPETRGRESGGGRLETAAHRRKSPPGWRVWKRAPGLGAGAGPRAKRRPRRPLPLVTT